MARGSNSHPLPLGTSPLTQDRCQGRFTNGKRTGLRIKETSPISLSVAVQPGAGDKVSLNLQFLIRTIEPVAALLNVPKLETANDRHHTEESDCASPKEMQTRVVTTLSFSSTSAGAVAPWPAGGLLSPALGSALNLNGSSETADPPFHSGRAP